MFGAFSLTCITVSATQNRSYNFNSNYSLTGDGATDMVRVASAQLGKTGSELGYSEQWCADFVSDCAILANQSDAVPAAGYCPTLRQNIYDAGGWNVGIYEAQAGDIVFYGNNGADHVEIVYDAYNGNVCTYGGNSGSGGSLYARSVRQHPTQTQSIAYIVRPNYNSSPNNFPGPEDTSYAVPYSEIATHRCDTYNSSGNKESDHYIAEGDYCYIDAVYENGFCHVEYDIPGDRRWAYAWAGDFNIPKKANKPSATNVSVSAGTDSSPTSFWWDASENVDHYDLKIWNGTYWEGDAYRIEWEIRNTSCSVQLPAGYYEAYVDSVNSEGCTMSKNVVRFTVEDDKADIGTKFYATIKNTKYNDYLTKIADTTNIYLQNKNNSSGQVWYFEQQEDGAYAISSCYDGKYLEMTDGIRENKTKISAKDDYWGGYYQQWYLIPCEDGYRLQSKHFTSEGWYLDRSANEDSNGNIVQIYEKFWSPDDQVWTITKTDKPFENLINSSIPLSENVKLGTYKTQDFSTNSKVKIKPAKAVKYNVLVKVKDSSGKIAEKTFTVNVFDALKNNSTVSSENIGLGDTVTIKAKATGGVGSYSYAVYYKKASAENWTTLQKYSDNTTVSFKPASAVKYDVMVKIKDSRGIIVKKTLTVNVTKPENTSKLSADTVKLGNTVTVSCSAKGGSGYYQYAVLYKKTSSEKWTTKQNYSSTSTVSIKPAAKATYDICVKVKDSLGNIAKKYFTVTVTK